METTTRETQTAANPHTATHTTTHTSGRPLALSDYIEEVAREGRRFAELADAGDLSVPIAACPGWDVRALIRHLAEIHLWAAANVAFPSRQWLNVPDVTALARFWPELAAGLPDDEDLVDWYRATNANLVEVLRSAPADVQAFTFLEAPTPLTMWARRQASETAIHRSDLELAFGIRPQFDPQVASDLLDELLISFAPWYRDVSEDRRVLRVVADDVGARWWISVGGGATVGARHGDGADLTIEGSAADLYVALWNREPASPLRLKGDADILRRWRDMCRVVWSG